MLAVSPQFKEAFNTVIVAQTTRLLQTVSFLVEARVRNTQKRTSVTMHDVWTAVDILGLPRNFAHHFSTLPSRIPILRESLEGKSITSSITQDDDVEVGKKVQYSRFTKTKILFPDNWDVNHGFDWDREEDPEGEESDDTLSTLDDDTADNSSPELDEGSDPVEDESDGEEESARDETALLDAETSYLEIYDAQLDRIELDRLHTFIKKGTRKAQSFHRTALKTFPSKQVDQARQKWTKTQKEWVYKREERWVDYGNEEEGDMEAREWEGFWKRNPNPLRSQRVSREEEGEKNGQINRGRKRRFEEDEDEDEDEDESEWSVYSD
jgi:hypothetical protein